MNEKNKTKATPNASPKKNNLAKKKNVYMSNDLARSRQGLTLSEKRLITLAMSTITATDTPINQFMRRTLISNIHADEYAKRFNISTQAAYKEMRSAEEKLFDRHISFCQLKPSTNETIWTKMRWISTVRYHIGKGMLELVWNVDLAHHISGLRSHFTTYSLDKMSKLRSIYSVRLFEILESYKDIKKAVFDIDKFNDIMEAPEKFRSNFAQIRRRIIEPSVKEIIEKTGYIIQWDAIKTGKKVVQVCFEFDNALKSLPECTRVED